MDSNLEKVIKLPTGFPFSNIFEEFITNYANSSTYWYVPKARALRDDETINDIRKTLQIIFDDFLDELWNQETQDKLLTRLVKEGILEPYGEGDIQDRTALIRINKKMWEVLGLLWVEENNSIVLTDAGFELLDNENPNLLIQNQIAKWQYPNPSIGSLKGFKGILPHLFLLQVLQRVNYEISRQEYDLFINLADSQEDLEQIVKYIKTWRDINESEKDAIIGIIKKIPFRLQSQQDALLDLEELNSTSDRSRYTRISQNSSYQRAFYTFPHYLDHVEGKIISTSEEELNNLVNNELIDLKVSTFKNKADWFSYFGDPKQQPTWFTYISRAVENAPSKDEAEKIVKENVKNLSSEEKNEIEKKQIEKGIEDFYIDNLSMIEEGLSVLNDSGEKEGRQYSTPIGQIDLLCKDTNGMYVVIEIKAEEAKDSVFGQILRYMGWIHRNFQDGENNVRGIILASDFPDTARYSRIGLIKEKYETFIKFSKHGFNLSTI